MEKREFNKWFSSFTDTIATWKYYTDFDKVYRNVGKIKDELNLLGYNNIKELSMGMSDDYLLAIKANATFVRLGRILFRWGVFDGFI